MIAALLAASLRLWAPTAFAALGGVLSERAGVINIGLEGMLLAGAYATVAAAAATGSPLAGLLAGTLTGALTGALHALLTQGLRVAPLLSGLGINLGALGATTYLLRLHGEGGLETRASLPAEGFVAGAAALSLSLWLLLERTPLGLRLRACGERPGAATAAGLSVAALRYGAVSASGALAGLGGAALGLTGLGTFTENMSAGRGYIALAAVIFGRWTAGGAAAAAWLFAAGDALQIGLQTAGLSRAVSADLLQSGPYLLTLAALALTRRRGAAPAALGEPIDQPSP